MNKLNLVGKNCERGDVLDVSDSLSALQTLECMWRMGRCGAIRVWCAALVEAVCMDPWYRQRYSMRTRVLTGVMTGMQTYASADGHAGSRACARVC